MFTRYRTNSKPFRFKTRPDFFGSPIRTANRTRIRPVPCKRKAESYKLVSGSEFVRNRVIVVLNNIIRRTKQREQIIISSKCNFNTVLILYTMPVLYRTGHLSVLNPLVPPNILQDKENCLCEENFLETS